MMTLRLRSWLAASGVLAVHSLQMPRTEAPTIDGMELIMLDDNEVSSRGSRCLDGSSPGFYYKEGSETDKWLLWFQGGGMCATTADCADSLPLHDMGESMDSLPLQEYGEFSNYHHVYFTSCDMGLYMGDRSDPVTYNGKTMYFQGARVVAHVIDVLQTNKTLSSAKEVLVAGGSGGGQAAFVMADYLKSLMPSSVQKFGAAPMNGWYVKGGDMDELKDMYSVANMGAALSPSCLAAFSDSEKHKCVDPATAYRYTKSNMFMIQIFDYTFEWNASDSLTSAYSSCLTDDAPSSSCDDDAVSLLNEYLSNYTQKLQTYPKYTENGQGGYLSTCTTHTFYNEDDLFNQYSNNGVTVGQAVSTWWQSLGTNPPAQWYLPCTLGSAPNPQCEETCG